MILYEVRNGIITVHSVKRRTNYGWTEHNNGRLTNTNATYAKAIQCPYYTESYEEALERAEYSINRMNQLLKSAHASIEDIKLFVENGEDEDNRPRSRLYDWVKEQ